MANKKTGIQEKIFLLFVLCLISVHTFGQIPSCRNFSLKQGLPQSEISCLFQDSRGLVWAGTKGGGLVQFDGTTFQIMNHRQGLKNDFIADIQETADHKIATGVTYGGIQYYDNRFFITTQQIFPGYNELKKVVVSGGSVYGISDKTIFKMGKDSTQTKTIFRFPHDVPEVQSHGWISDQWILASEDSGLWVVNTQKPGYSELLKTKGKLLGHKVVGINPINGTSAALVSHDGQTAVLDFKNNRPVLSNWDPLQNTSLNQGEEIKCAVFGLGQNVKWLATNKRRVISSSGEIIDLSQSVSNLFHSINCLLLDRNGSLWIGTQGSGIVIKPAHTGYSFENLPLLMNTSLLTVFMSKDKTLMAGGRESGLLVRMKDRETGKWRVKVLYPSLTVHAIGETSQRYLLGTDQGMYILDKENFGVVSYFRQPGKTILFKSLPKGEVLIGTYGKGAWMLDGSEKLIPLTTPGSNPAYVYGFEEEEPGRFLIPSNSGLWQLNLANLTIQKVNVPSSVGGLFFIATKDSYKNIWFTTVDGLACKTRKGWAKIKVSDGLSSNLLYTLNADSLGHLWVGTNHGLDRVTIDPNGKLLEIRNFGPDEGFEGYEANMRASCLNDNLLYICTIQGLFAMPVKSKVLDPLPPKPEITQIRGSFRSGNWIDSIPGIHSSWFLTDRKDVLIEGNPGGLAISFNAINPVYPNKLLYSYKLDEDEKGWSHLSHEKEAIAIDLGTGKHTFRVRTSYDGITFSQPSVFSFEIAAPWFLSPWVIVGGLIVVLLLFSWAARSLVLSFSSQPYLRQDLEIPERTSQLILFIFTLFYPLTLIVSARFESSVYLNPLLLSVLTGTIALFLILSFFLPLVKNQIRLLLIASFLLFVGDTSFSIVKSNMAPFHCVALLYISTLAFLVFTNYWQIILFGLFLNGFAGWCHFYFQSPLYNPVPFQMGAIGLSMILIIIHLAKKSGEEKLLFANKVVNSGPVLVLGFRLDGTLVFSSENIIQMLGYASWELAGQAWWSNVVNVNEDVMALLGNIQEKREGEIRVRLRNKAGAVRSFVFTGRAINEDMMVMIGQDTTERESLEARFEHLVENAPDAIYQTDFYGKLVYANPQTSFILGIPNKELIDCYYTDFLREDVKESVIEFYRNQTKNRIPSTYHEFPVVTKHGQVRWLGFQVSLLTSNGGKKIDGFLSIGRDITERLEAEQLIQYQHKNITDSVSYANRIKSAILPGESALKSIFTHVAVYNKPKDIIGGDFFWLTHFGRKHLFVVGDCTGHGVPGAFMTTISVGLLRELVKEDSNWNVEEILGLFNRSLLRLLGSNSEIESPDFVELALLAVDFEKNKIHFISSGISLNMLRNGSMHTYREGSRGHNFRYDYSGMSQEITIKPGDVFYLFTDGMFDQLGGPKQKRLSKKGLIDIIKRSDQISLSQGMEEIKSELEEWQGQTPQIDDRLMISFRF